MKYLWIGLTALSFMVQAQEKEMTGFSYKEFLLNDILKNEHCEKMTDNLYHCRKEELIETFYFINTEDLKTEDIESFLKGKLGEDATYSILKIEGFDIEIYKVLMMKKK